MSFWDGELDEPSNESFWSFIPSQADIANRLFHEAQQFFEAPQTAGRFFWSLPQQIAGAAAEQMTGQTPLVTGEPGRSFTSNDAYRAGGQNVNAVGSAGLLMAPFAPPGMAIAAQSKPAGMVRLFHGTTDEGIEGIKRDHRVNSPAFFSNRKEIAELYGPHIVKADVPKNKIMIDADLPGGRLLSIEEANDYFGNHGWTVDDYLASNYSFGVLDDVTTVLFANRGADPSRAAALNSAQGRQAAPLPTVKSVMEMIPEPGEVRTVRGYHGTPDAGFVNRGEMFKPSKGKRSHEYGEGIYVHTDKNTAGLYRDDPLMEGRGAAVQPDIIPLELEGRFFRVNDMSDAQLQMASGSERGFHSAGQNIGEAARLKGYDGLVDGENYVVFPEAAGKGVVRHADTGRILFANNGADPSKAVALSNANKNYSKSERVITLPDGGGVGGVVSPDGTTLHIGSAWLDESQRGQGIGKALYRQIIDDARADGLKVVSDRQVSGSAANIYRSLGAEQNPRASVSAGGTVTAPNGEPAFIVTANRGADLSKAAAASAAQGNAMKYGVVKSREPVEQARALRDAIERDMPGAIVKGEAHQTGVSSSVGPAGKSAYVHTKWGDIRISDHYANADFRVGQISDLPVQSDLDLDDFIAGLRHRVAKAEQRSIERRKREQAEKDERRARNADVTAQHNENRRAKLAFWKQAGLENATETAKRKAWKAHKAKKKSFWTDK